MVQPDQEAPLTKRELRNAQHVGDWLAGKVKPDLVRLAEYAMTQDAHLTPTEIERQLTRDLERAIDATDGGEPLSPEAGLCTVCLTQNPYQPTCAVFRGRSSSDGSTVSRTNGRRLWRRRTSRRSCGSVPTRMPRSPSSARTSIRSPPWDWGLAPAGS